MCCDERMRYALLKHHTLISPHSSHSPTDPPTTDPPKLTILDCDPSPGPSPDPSPLLDETPRSDPLSRGGCCSCSRCCCCCAPIVPITFSEAILIESENVRGDSLPLALCLSLALLFSLALLSSFISRALTAKERPVRIGACRERESAGMERE